VTGVTGRSLNELLDFSASKYASQIAAVEPGSKAVRYDELHRAADRLCSHLISSGVVRGDRIGIQAPKSIAVLAAIFGILKAGAAYVPVDRGAPKSRNAFIFSNCAVKHVIVSAGGDAEAAPGQPAPVPLGSVDPLLSELGLQAGPGNLSTEDVAVPDGLAYILYTSGSTGLPKGVMLTHLNALAFIDWCSSAFEPSESDRFSSHAPFHFDLSILDIYLSIKHGSTLVLIPDDTGKNPKELAPLIAAERLSIWYSTPSILKLLLEVKGIEDFDHSSLRTVLFAGEVFPVKHLRRLMGLWSTARFYNLYGPTETNVCTYYAVPQPAPVDDRDAIPIGKPCSGDVTKVTDDLERELPSGEEGELCVAGPSVTSGYWNLPDRNASAFFTDDRSVRWYKTGDVVRENAEGDYVYVGRRDRMVKRHGYRVELGEIEAALHRHDSIGEAAVVATADATGDLRITAFVSCEDDRPPSIIALKRFCMENLPAYMIPDRFLLQASLPKTSTQKIDYQRLKELA
jgi:amino acid adenylation domain-containing protein